MLPLPLKLTALALAAVVWPGASAAPASAAPGEPLATAAYGRAQVAIKPDPQRGNGVWLTYTADADAPEQVLPVELPKGASPHQQSVGLGLDATGLLTAVLHGPRGIYWTHVTRPGRLHRLAKTADGQYPAIYRGRVAYVCDGGAAICKASLRTKARSVLHREPGASPWRLYGVRIGPRDALALEAQRDGALGASRIQIKRPGKKPATVADANLDSNEAVVLRDVSPAGDHLTILRRTYAPDGDPRAAPADLVSIFTFPGAKKVI